MQGMGTYTLKGDSLTLFFEEHTDPRNQNCSWSNVRLLDSRYATDSIEISFEVLDCMSNDSSPFASIHVRKPGFTDRLKEYTTGMSGRGKFRLARSELPLEIVASAPEYHPRIIHLGANIQQDMHIVASLSLDMDRFFIKKGEIIRYTLVDHQDWYITLLYHGSPYDEAVDFMQIEPDWEEAQLMQELMEFFPESFLTNSYDEDP